MVNIGMYYLMERNGWRYFNRRIPNELRSKYPAKQEVVREALKTKDRKLALRLAIARNDQLEAYWRTLGAHDANHAAESYKALVDRANMLGYAYLHNSELPQLALLKIIERLLHVEKENYNEKNVDA